MLNPSERIRSKFREEIRSRQIQEIMRVIREKANNSEAKGDCFWAEAYQKVENSSLMGIDMQLIEELISYLNQYPDHPNTYLLIENYVQIHNLSRDYFFLRVLSVYDLAKKIPNYKRCLLTFLLKNEPIDIHILKEYDHVGSELIKHCQNDNDDRWEMLAILSLILTLDHEQKEEKFFPHKFMSEFFNTLTYFWDPSKLSPVLKYVIMNIMHCVGEEHLDHPIIKDNYTSAMNLLKIGIAEFPKHRSSFLSYLKILMFDNFDAFENMYKRNEGKELMREIIYTYRYVVSERLKILEIYQYIVKESEFQSFISLLNQDLHLSLMETFENHEPDHLRLCLRIILDVLERLAEKEEEEILDKVLTSMEELKFKVYLEELVKERHDSTIESHLTEILDTYYSEEIQ